MSPLLQFPFTINTVRSGAVYVLGGSLEEPLEVFSDFHKVPGLTVLCINVDHFNLFFYT